MNDTMFSSTVIYITGYLNIGNTIEQGPDGITQNVIFFLKRCFINESLLVYNNNSCVTKIFYVLADNFDKDCCV